MKYIIILSTAFFLYPFVLEAVRGYIEWKVHESKRPFILVAITNLSFHIRYLPGTFHKAYVLSVKWYKNKLFRKKNPDLIESPMDFIPNGIYCSSTNMRCPFWDAEKGSGYGQNYGYCHLLKLRDWDHGTYLWDGIKECGYKDAHLQHYTEKIFKLFDEKLSWESKEVLDLWKILEELENETSKNILAQ